MHSFGYLNSFIVSLFLIANLALGYISGRGVTTAQDFNLGNGKIPWWAIGMSVIATYISALSFLGGPAWAYQDGMSALAIHLNYPIVVFIVIFLFLPFFYNSGVASIYEYQERRFGPTSRSVMSLIFLVSQALTTAAILYAASLVLQFVTGMDVLLATIIIAATALVYTAMGGMVAVIWTDVFQAVVLIGGTLIIIFALMSQIPEDLVTTLSALKAQGKMNAIITATDITRPTTIWSGVIAMTLYHVTVYGANQMMVQRTLGARTIGDAKKAYLLMGFAAFPIYFLFFFVGVLCFAFYEGREFENTNEIILIFAQESNIPGLLGILVAAVLAASMSTLSSALNSLATVSYVDFYQKFAEPGLQSSGNGLRITRIFTVFWAVAIIFPAMLYANTEGSILEMLTKIGSYFVGAKLGMYGLGFFSKHTTEKGLLVGVAAGFAMIWFIATQTNISWPWYCAIGASVNIAISIPASLILTGKQKTWSRYTVRGQQEYFALSGLDKKQDGWYLVPGMIDRPLWLLPIFFIVTITVLIAFNFLIP